MTDTLFCWNTRARPSRPKPLWFMILTLFPPWKWKMGLWKMSSVSRRAIFHFSDCWEKSTFPETTGFSVSFLLLVHVQFSGCCMVDPRFLTKKGPRERRCTWINQGTKSIAINTGTWSSFQDVDLMVQIEYNVYILHAWYSWPVKKFSDL